MESVILPSKSIFPIITESSQNFHQKPKPPLNFPPSKNSRITDTHLNNLCKNGRLSEAITVLDTISQNGHKVVVDFTASWCGPCRFIAPILADIAKKMPHVIFLKVDVDELPTVTQEWSVEAMPTFVFLKEGKEVDRVVGAKKDELVKTIEKHAAAPATVTA